MLFIYIFTLIILALILLLLWKEERRLKDRTTHGLANKFWILRERRKFVRFDEEIKIKYHLQYKSQNFHDAKISNISNRGLCILTYEKLKEKQCMGLEVQLPEFSRPIKLTAQVIWIKDLKTQDEQGRRLFYTGIKFLKIDPDSEARLLTHLNKLSP